MAFQKLTWQDSNNGSYTKEINENGIPLCAADMNRLENAIADHDSQSSQLILCMMPKL